MSEIEITLEIEHNDGAGDHAPRWDVIVVARQGGIAEGLAVYPADVSEGPEALGRAVAEAWQEVKEERTKAETVTFTEPCTCAGTGDHTGQGIEACDECDPSLDLAA